MLKPMKEDYLALNRAYNSILKFCLFLKTKYIVHFLRKLNTYKARVLSMRYFMYFRAFYILTLYSVDIYNFLYFISMFVVK